MDGWVRRSERDERECRGWAGQAGFYELCMQLDAESASQAPSHQVPYLPPLSPFPFLPSPRRFSKGIGSNALLAASAPFTVQHTCKLEADEACYVLNVESAMPIFTVRASQCAGGDVIEAGWVIFALCSW